MSACCPSSVRARRTSGRNAAKAPVFVCFANNLDNCSIGTFAIAPVFSATRPVPDSNARNRAQIAGRGSIDQERLVTPGKKVPAQFVSPVKTHRVCTEQPFHSLNQICSRSLYHQMKMIVHQAIGMKLPAGLLARRAQGLGENFFDPDRPEKSPHADRPGSLEINSSLVLNSQLARYRQVLIQTCNLRH